MAPAAFEIIESCQRLEALPVRIRQRTPWGSAATRLALLLPTLMLVLVPAALVLGSAAAPAYAAEHPVEAALTGAGLALFTLLFGLPLNSAVRALGLRRRVLIDAGHVTVEEQTPFGCRIWTLPLSDYDGIAHVVRTSLSQARHELVLVHPCRRHQVLLAVADRMSEADVAGAAHLLGLAVVSAEHVLLPRAAATPQANPLRAAPPVAPLEVPASLPQAA